MLPSEGGRTAYAPGDSFEDRLLARLRRRHAQVVTEHVVAGPGLAAIHEALGGHPMGNARIWDALADASDPLIEAAAARWCGALGAAAGDYALVHGSSGIVLSGGLALRMADRLRASAFAARFADKMRYEAMMADIPIKLLTDPQPGLTGAVAAFIDQHGMAA